jgi:hypothetical protein
MLGGAEIVTKIGAINEIINKRCILAWMDLRCPWSKFIRADNWSIIAA